jgi:hypothetical protein
MGPVRLPPPHLTETIAVNTKERARQVLDQLSAKLAELETLGALIAAAQLEAAIDSLAKEFNLERSQSEVD